MPTLKHTISDDEHVAYKRAAALAFMPVSVWMRSNLGRLAQEAAPKADDKPVMGKVEARRLAQAEQRKINAAASEEQEMRGMLAMALDKDNHWHGDLAAYIAYGLASANEPARAYTAKFEAWARAQGHLQGE